MRLRVLPVLLVTLFLSVMVKLSDAIFTKLSDSGKIIIAQLEARAQEEDEEEFVDEEVITTPNATKPTTITPSNVSQMEENILENLAARRRELEDWRKSIILKENILAATEKKINRKIEELDKLEKKVSDLLSVYEKREDAKIKRLVKIYESMKPKDAASIFEDMDLEILIDVISSMKEVKAAPILAKMQAQKAQQITVRLASRGRLNK